MKIYFTLATAFLFITQSLFSSDVISFSEDLHNTFEKGQTQSYFKNTAFMFRMKKDEKTIYFQGTIHFLPYETLCPASQNIIENATVRYLEYTSDSKISAEEFKSILDCVIKPEEHKRMRELLTEEFYKILKNATEERIKELEGREIDFINILKERNFQFNQLGGIGLYFASDIYGQKKGMGMHIAEKYLDSKSLDEKINPITMIHFLCSEYLNQDEAVKESIFLGFAEKIKTNIKNCSDFYAPYKKGDLKFFRPILNEFILNESIKNRNHIWFQKLKSEVLKSEEYVVACGGTGHIELLSLFKKDGFSVEIMDRNGVFYPFEYASIENQS